MTWNINYEKAFKCPSCGGENLHHDAVDVYFRKHEDAPEGMFIRCADDASIKSISPEGNPSNRRDGLVITFWCESCDDRPQLAILQHKGTTFHQWRHNGDENE